jgi:hypothetical protein
MGGSRQYAVGSRQEKKPGALRRAVLQKRGEHVMKAKKLDADLVLRRLAEIRKLIPLLNESALHQPEDGRGVPVHDIHRQRREELAYAAIADGIATLATDFARALGAAFERKRTANWKSVVARYLRRRGITGERP